MIIQLSEINPPSRYFNIKFLSMDVMQFTINKKMCFIFYVVAYFAKSVTHDSLGDCIPTSFNFKNMRAGAKPC